MSRQHRNNHEEVETIDDDLDIFAPPVNGTGIVLGPDDEILSTDGGVIRFKRRVVKMVEVPYTRKVKVPVVTRKVVPTTFSKRIKTKKFVEKQVYQEEEEKYTVFEEVKAFRTNTVWKQVIQQEEYMKKVPVTKTRMVKKPVTRVREEEFPQEVDVPGTRVEIVDSWRIDDIEDRKTVKVESWEVYNLMPHKEEQQEKKTIQHKVLGTVESSSQQGSRQMGNTIYVESAVDTERLMAETGTADHNDIELDVEHATDEVLSDMTTTTTTTTTTEIKQVSRARPARQAAPVQAAPVRQAEPAAEPAGQSRAERRKARRARRNRGADGEEF